MKPKIPRRINKLIDELMNAVGDLVASAEWGGIHGHPTYAQAVRAKNKAYRDLKEAIKSELEKAKS